MSKTINLLPDPVIETQRQATTVYQGTVVSIIGFIIFVLLNLIFLFFVVRTNGQYDQVVKEAERIEQEIRTYADISTDLRSLRGLIQRHVRMQRGHMRVGEVIESVTTDGDSLVVFNEIELKDGELVLTNSTSSLEDAVTFLRSVRTNSLFSDIVVNDIGYKGLTQDIIFKTTVTLANVL